VSERLKLVPGFYKTKWANYVWVVSFILLTIMLYLNYRCHLLEEGIYPVHLPMKLGVLTDWLLSLGMFFWFSTLAWWDYCLDKNLLSRLVVLILLSVALSISLLSRGLIFANMTALLVAVLFYRLFSGKLIHLLGFVLLVSLGFSIAVAGVTYRRNLLYPKLKSNVGIEKAQDVNADALIKKIKKLAIYRWVGVEGLMSVSAWPHKGVKLLRGIWRENTKFGPNTYDVISSTTYLRNLKKYEFGFLPGPIALFYYSGSMIVVFIAMCLLTYLLMIIEQVFYKIFPNPFLIAIFAIDMSLNFTTLIEMRRINTLF